MLKKTLCILCFLAALSPAARAAAQEASDRPDTAAGAFVGQDLLAGGPNMIGHRLDNGPHILVFPAGFTMSIGAHEYAAEKAVLLVDSVRTKYGQNVRTQYRARAYLQGNIDAGKAVGAKTTDLRELIIEPKNIRVTWFSVTGQIFLSADQRETADPRNSQLYARAYAAFRIADIEPEGIEARPLVKPRTIPVGKPAGPDGKTADDRHPDEAPEFQYPLNWGPAGDVQPQFEGAKAADGTPIATLIGRFYMWQKQDDQGDVLALEADCAVVFFAKDAASDANDTDLLGGGRVQGVYLCGDVIMTEGPRTIRAKELYYDFLNSRAVVVDAEMRTFDPDEGIPIYVRAAKLRQVAKNRFAAEDASLTTSEFNDPQIELKIGDAVITDTTGQNQPQSQDAEKSYEIDMHDVDLKVYDKTILHLPHMHADSERPDIPIKSAHFGHSSRWGNLLETRWYMSRLLGYEEPEGVESTFALDFYDRRGLGGGVEVDYAKANYFGRTLGYIIHDTGEDRLGRHDSRRNLEPPRKLRGRYLWQHRHYLPENWQLTGEFSYISDENFMEGYYRSEYYVGKRQETLLHLKKSEDNWGFSGLSKVRINDFSSELEELPTLEFHKTGESFWDDRLTFYSDTQLSRLRQRYGSSSSTGSQDFFSFATTRNEVDMPLTIGRARVVPFVAGTVAYEDGMGFYRDLDGATARREDQGWWGEGGVRVSGQPYWKVYPNARSRLWDIEQLRHVLRPYMTAVSYADSDSPFEQRDTLNVGISQRLQTKRGTGENRRTVDWMRLDTDVTWVTDSGSASAGPDQFIWNRPLIPAFNDFGAGVPRRDRRSSMTYGPRRNYFSADYMWRMTDTTALLSDMNLDMQSGVVQQFNIGFSRMRWPNLSYYIGSRYLRRVVISDSKGNVLQKGSQAFVFALSYVLDPRYTLVFSQQYDFDYEAVIRSELTLLRRYHRMFWGLTYRADESLDESSIVLSLWPQGVEDLSIGPRRYMGLGGVAGY